MHQWAAASGRADGESTGRRFAITRADDVRERDRAAKHGDPDRGTIGGAPSADRVDLARCQPGALRDARNPGGVRPRLRASPARCTATRDRDHGRHDVRPSTSHLLLRERMRGRQALVAARRGRDRSRRDRVPDGRLDLLCDLRPGRRRLPTDTLGPGREDRRPHACRGARRARRRLRGDP